MLSLPLVQSNAITMDLEVESEILDNKICHVSLFVPSKHTV